MKSVLTKKEDYVANGNLETIELAFNALKHASENHYCLKPAAVLIYANTVLAGGCLQLLLIWHMPAFLCLGRGKNNISFFLLLIQIHIQRTEGCDHMTCSQCNTNFCYRCGERYRQLRFFGDHTSNLSIFGCKYRYLPERPHLRRLVRGSVCGEWINAPCGELHSEVVEGIGQL